MTARQAMESWLIDVGVIGVGEYTLATLVYGITRLYEGGITQFKLDSPDVRDWSEVRDLLGCRG